MRLRSRFALRTSSVGRALVLVLLLGHWGSVSAYDPVLDPLRDLVVRTVTRFVTSSLQGSIEVGALRGSLLSAPVLQNITLRDKHGTVVGQVAELRLAYDLRTLLTKRLAIRTIEIVRPQITLVQEPDGSLNIANLLPPSQPSSSEAGQALALVIDDLRIRDGQLAVRHSAVPGIQSLADIQVRLGAQLDEAGLRVQVQQCTAHASPAEVKILTLQGALQKLKGVVQIDHLRLQTEQTTIMAHGVLPGGTQESPATLQMQPLDLAEIGRLVDDTTLQGQVTLDLQAVGPAEAVQMRGQLSAGAGSATLQSQINTAVAPLRYDGTLEIMHLNLAELKSQSARQSDLNMQLRIEGAGVSLQELHGALQLEISPSQLGDIAVYPSRIHLEAREQRFQVQHFDLHTSIARATASGTLALSSPLDMQYTFTADLARLQQYLVGTAALAGALQTQGEINGTWPDLSGQGAMEVRDLRYQDGRVGALRFTYAAAHLGTQPQITVQVLARHALVSTLPIEQVKLDATYQGTEPQLSFTADVVQAAGNGGQARGTLTLDAAGQRLVLEEFQIRLPGRTWRAAAPLQVAFGPQRFEATQVHLVHAEESLKLSGAMQGDQLQDLRLDATQIDLSYWQRLLHLSEFMNGRVTLQAQLTGTRAEPDLKAELTLQQAAVQQLPYTRYHNTLVYAQRQLQSSGQLYQGDSEVMTLEARLPFDLALTDLPLGQRLIEAPIEIRMRFQQPHLAAMRQWQPALPRMEGRLAGTIDIQGTYTALDLAASTQLQQFGIEGLVAQVRGPIHLHGSFVTATSMAELAQAIEQRQLTPQMRQLVLRIPTLHGLWLAQGTPGKPVQVDDLLLQASAQLTANGPQATLEEFHLRTTGLGLPRTEVRLAGKWTPARLDVTRLDVRAAQSEVHGQGHLTLPEQRAQFRLDIPHLRLDTLGLALPPTLPPVVQGVLTVHGLLSAPQVEARLQYAGAQLQANLSAQLQERVPRYQGTLRLDGLDLARVLPAASGRLQATAQLQGTGLTPQQRQASLDLTVETTGFTLAPGLNAQLRATLTGTALQLARLQVRSTPVELTASGTLSAASQVALQYRLTLGDLTSLQPLLGMPLEASGGLTGEVQGPLSALRTRGTLQLDAWRVADLRGQRLQGTFTAAQGPSAPQATLRAQLVNVQGPSLPPSSLSVEGTFTPQQGTVTLSVTDGPYQRSRLAGKVVLTQGQRLTLQTLRLQHQSLVWENTAPVEIGRSPQGVVQIQSLSLRSGSQAIRLQGTLNPRGAVQAEVQVQRLSLQPTARAFAPGLDVPNGRLDLSLTIRGTWQQPQMQGTLQLIALRWQRRELGDMQATVALNGTTLQTELHWRAQGGEFLQVRGTMRLDAAKVLDVRLQVPTIDLAMLKPFIPAVTQSAGTLSGDLHVTGTLQQPQVNGSLVLRDGVLQLATTGEPYKNIQARITLAGDRVTFEQLQLESRSGPLHVTGWIEHTGLTLRRIDVAVSAHNFAAIRTPSADAVISAQLTVRGTLQEAIATGRVTVPQAHIHIDKIPGSGPKTVQPWELTLDGVYGPGPKAVATGKGSVPVPTGYDLGLPFLSADIQLDLPRNVWVQGSGTAIELSGQMRVTKALRQPVVLSGSIETVRGFATYYTKRFNIKSGQVTFTGTPEINPLLDVTLAQRVSDYDVSIHVTGKAQQPTIVFSSTPELSQGDIVSLLVLGKTTDRLTKSERNSLGNEAQQLAGNILAGQLEKNLGSALGLDTLDISAGSQLGTGSVRMGRYVTQDLFLSLEQQLGQDSSAAASSGTTTGGTTIGAEYSLNRNLKLRGSSSDRGATALDVLWRMDY